MLTPEPPKRDTQALTRGSFDGVSAISPLLEPAAGAVGPAATAGRSTGDEGLAAPLDGARAAVASSPRAPVARVSPGSGSASDPTPFGIPSFFAALATPASRSARGAITVGGEAPRRDRSACAAARTCSGETVVAPTRAARLAASSASASIARWTPSVSLWISRQALRENMPEPAAPSAPERWSR